jgi:hypothetical protein
VGASVHLRDETSGSGPLWGAILETLPTWFGIPESVDDYVALADTSLAFAGVEFLQYPATRHRLRQAEGALPGPRIPAPQEFPALWGPENPALPMLKVMAPT